MPPLKSLGFVQFCGREILFFFNFIFSLRWMQLSLTFNTSINVTPSLSLPWYHSNHSLADSAAAVGLVGAGQVLS